MYNPSLVFYCREKRPQSLTVTTHSHNCYELVYFTKVNGQLTVDGRTMPLNPGNIHFIYPNSPHSETHNTDYEVLFIGFEHNSFPKHVLKETVYNIPEHNEILNLMNRIIEESRNQKKNYSEITSHLLSEIILLMERYTTDDAKPVKAIDYAFNYICEYFNQSINFPQLAKTTGYSYDRFRHLFTETYSISPKQLQINMRLEKSVELLAEDSMSCTDIAQQCGFSTSAQFSKLFRDRYGINPKQFHKRHD